MLFTVTATHAFVNPEPTDLSFNEGDKLHVLEMTEDYWWKARDALGKVGMIPSNYIRRDGIESEKYVIASDETMVFGGVLPCVPHWTAG